MVHNKLSRSLEDIPMWIVQAAIGAIIIGTLGFATWSTKTTIESKERISVVETKVYAQKDDLSEIKGDVKEINHKIDRLIERRQR